MAGQEKYRSNGPLISEPQWDALLRENGFSGLDLCLQDYPGEPAHTSKRYSCGKTLHVQAKIDQIA